MIDRIVGSIVGLMVGNALGARVEGWTPQRIRNQFGTLRDYDGRNRTPGVYTDDAQQALCLLDSILNEGDFSPSALAAKFVELGKPLSGTTDETFGVFRDTGSGFRQGVSRLTRGADWRESGTVSAGNGPAARVAPLALYRREDRKRLLINVVDASWITHRDPRGPAGALAVAFSVAHAAQTGKDFAVKGYLNRLLTFLREGEEYLRREYFSPDLGVPEEVCGHMSQAVELARGLLTRSTEDALEQIGQFARECTHLPARATSAFVIGSGTTSVYTFAKHHRDFEEAVVASINLGGDTDTIGAMVGAMAGALHGWTAIPERWREGLRNHDEIYRRAHALAEGNRMPPDARSLREMEAELTLEAPR